MQIQRQSLYLTRIVSDFLMLSLSFLLSLSFSENSGQFFFTDKHYFILFVLMVGWYISAKQLSIYDEYRSRDFTLELIMIFQGIISQAIVLVVVLFFLKEQNLSRMFVINYIFLFSLALFVEKYLFRSALNYLRIKGRNLRNLLIVGAGPVGKEFFDSVGTNPHFGYRLIGFLDDKDNTLLNGKYLGRIDELEKVLSLNHVDDVIIALPNYAADKMEVVVQTCERFTTRVKIIPDYFKFTSGKYNISFFGKFPMIAVRSDRMNEFHWRLCKRLFDTIFTILLFLTVFWWLWPLLSASIKIDSKGQVFFKQIRWGRNNKKFKAIKFRSMVEESCDIDVNGRFIQASKNDPRITKLGRFLRKSNLDELPQFINVLKGEMSLVGPRPHPTPLNLESKDKIHLYMQRHLVKPGITGWAQVNGFRGETKDSALMKKRIEYDLWYIENWTFWLDIRIILMTIITMLKGDKNAY